MTKRKKFIPSEKNIYKPVDKRLRLYNQYPGNYASFEAMESDLPRIAAMGFKQVWVNPFYLTSQENPFPGYEYKIHCPYAMKDHHVLNPEYGASFEAVKSYTRKAKELGLSPIFDLVMNHVAIDHSFVNGDPELAIKGIDTKKWFKRHLNGNLVIKGFDDNYQLLPGSRNPWADVATFNYDDPKIRREIIENFWKPFIYKNIVELGFMGARIDAPGRIPPSVHQELLSYVDELCRQQHKAHAYIVAETVGSGNVQNDRDAINGVATHAMNSSFWMPGPEGRTKRDGPRDEYHPQWKDDGNWYAHAKGVLQTAAPTAGHSGSHDEERYPEILEHQGITDPTVVKQRMLEMIMVAAFGSDGGHILAYGDEYGVKERVNVHQRKVINLEEEKQYDLTADIMHVNEIVEQLPTPTFPEWVQRVFVDKYPELVVFIVHQGEGFSGNSHVIIGNSYNSKSEDKNIICDQAMLTEIMKANGRNNSPEKCKLPNRLYLCGNIKPGSDLTVPVSKDKSYPENKKRKKYD